MDQFITQNGQYVPGNRVAGGGGSTPNAYVLGGNAFGQVAALGLLDAFTLNLIVAGSTFLSIDPAVGVLVPGDFAVGGTLEQLTAPTLFFRVGTVDAFARRQVWFTEASSVLRLGADTADGDPFDADSEGIVVYHPTGDQLGRMKGDRFGLTRSSDSSLYYFRVDQSALFYRANPPGGAVWFNIDRTTGLITAAGSAEVTGYVQAGVTPPIGAFGDLRAGESFAGDAAIRVGVLADLQQTSGNDTGSVFGAFFRCSTLGASSTFGPSGVQGAFEHGGTGTVNSTADAVIGFIGTNFEAAPATAIGALGTAQAFDAIPDLSAGASASAVAMVGFRARGTFGTDATHTITAAYGVLVDNQGATGVSQAAGVDVRRQTGASLVNVGVRNAGSTAFTAQSPAAFGAAINNLPNPDTTWLRMEASAAIDWTGIALGIDGQILVACNVGAVFAITVRHLNGGSIGANQFILAAGLPQILGPGDTIAFIYDAQTSKWRQFVGLV